MIDPARHNLLADHRLPRGAALLCTVLLLGCGPGTDFSNDSLPAPAISVGESVASCSAGTGATLTLYLEATRVIEAAPGQAPENRAVVSGLATGLGASDAVFLVLTPIASACPAAGVTEAVVEPSGEFSGVLDLGNRRAFRVTAVAYDGVAGDLDCDAAADCLLAAPGIVAISGSIRIVLG